MTVRDSSERDCIPRAGRQRAGMIVLPLLGCLALFGCGRANKEQPKELPSPSAAVQLPEVTETPDEIRAQMKKLTSDQQRGTPEFEDLRLKLMVANDKIIQREGVEGYRTCPVERTTSMRASVDPQTGEIAWRGMTCYNPDCPGRGKGGGPLMFVDKSPHVHIDANNQVVFDYVEIKPLVDDKPPVVCPSCGRVEFLEFYCSAETEVRRRQLYQELNDVRAARGKAHAAGAPEPSGLRTVTEIIREIEELPKLFLVPKE